VTSLALVFGMARLLLMNTPQTCYQVDCHHKNDLPTMHMTVCQEAYPYDGERLACWGRGGQVSIGATCIGPVAQGEP